MSFSERIVAVRKKRKMTQQQMADAIGIHVSQIKRYESGKTQPSLEVMHNIALALNVSADLLLFDQDEPGPEEELKLQFETVSLMPPREKAVIKELLEGMIIKHEAHRWLPKERHG